MIASLDSQYIQDGHPLAILQDCQCLRQALLDQQHATIILLNHRVLPLLESVIHAVSTVAITRFGPDYHGAFAAEAERLKDLAKSVNLLLAAYRSAFPELNDSTYNEAASDT